jgi:hypothetical protein
MTTAITSEGTASARRINQRVSLTPDALLLHRVDTSHLQPTQGVAIGACRTDRPASQRCTQDCSQGKACTCADGLCLEACSAFAEPDDQDTSHEFTRSQVLAVVYVLFLACMARLAWLAARLG